MRKCLFMAFFNYFTYSMNYIRALSIDFHILNICLFIEVNIFKTYFSQYHTPPDHHRVVHWSEHINLLLTISYSPRSSQGKTIHLFSLKHRACISTLLCITLIYGYINRYIDHSNPIDFLQFLLGMGRIFKYLLN
jgi:hypothetical protein